MKKFKVRHKKTGRGRPSKTMKAIEDIMNDSRISDIVEEAARLAVVDQTLFGQILPDTQEKIEKLLESMKENIK